MRADADHPELTVCQLPDNAFCVTRPDCKDKQLCASDGQCRDWCSAAESCPLDLRCAASGFCARSEELDEDGDLPRKDGGTGGTPGEGGTSSGVEQAGAGTKAMSSGGSANGTAGVRGEAGQASSGGGAGGNGAIGGASNSGGNVALGGSFDPRSGGARAEGGASSGTGGSEEPGLVDESEPNGERTRPMSFPVGSTVQATFLDSDYKVQIKYTKASDAAEPNDTRQTARPLNVGEVANGLLFAGYRAAAISEYDDWYAVNLSAGAYTALLTQVPASTNAMAYIWNSAGTRLTGDTNGNRGGT